jgi:hypothetical protein
MVTYLHSGLEERRQRLSKRDVILFEQTKKALKRFPLNRIAWQAPNIISSLRILGVKANGTLRSIYFL